VGTCVDMHAQSFMCALLRLLVEGDMLCFLYAHFLRSSVAATDCRLFD
jgi:hypothetical protein